MFENLGFFSGGANESADCQISSSMRVESDGFALVRDVFGDECDAIVSLLSTLPQSNKVRRRQGVYGVRDLFGVLPQLAPLVCSQKMRELVEPIIGPDFFAVRSILFDKPPGANWMVPWHQDLSIAVKRRIDAPEFGPWSVKAEIVHVQPPVGLLARMLTVRVHLDDCDASNGALYVLPGSHTHGRLSAAAIRELRVKCDAVACAVPRGGCLIMRPLLVHASKPSEAPSHRRVVHIELASEELPHGIEWYERVAAK